MKKSILFLSFLALLSCNKTKQEITNTTNDNTTESNIHLAEMNSQQISEIITPKQNDTIYITNFFATWCGPCMHEIPFIKEKMEELNGEKVKFTFISVDRPKDWSIAVNQFAKESGLAKNIVLFNTEQIPADFFTKHFETWNSASIPFTLITKGNQRIETIGMMRKQELSDKINALK